jgi:ADP-ribosylglycohydrolase
MMTNTLIFERLLADAEIDLDRGKIFASAPGPLAGEPEAGIDFDRVEGMLLGLAIGDALGRPTEGMHPELRLVEHGEIRDYLPNALTDGQAIGLPSDDTQLSFWSLEQLLHDGGLKPDKLARHLATGRVFGIGKGSRQALRCIELRAQPWTRCGVKSAGNGALMRIAPILLPHLREGRSELWTDVALAGLVTHNDSASFASCLAFSHMLRQLLAMDEVPEAAWWPATWIEISRDIEVDPTYRSRARHFADFQGPLWRFVERALDEAVAKDWSVLEACNAWHSGAYLLETVPSLLYILMRHAADPETAILRAVNDTVDNDSIAALVGAAVGALHGHDALPERWIEGLSGRTRDNDDGQVFGLLAEAGRVFGEG